MSSSSLTRHHDRRVQIVLGPVLLADGITQTRLAVDVWTEVDVPISEWPAVLLKAAECLRSGVDTTPIDMWPGLLALKSTDTQSQQPDEAVCISNGTSVCDVAMKSQRVRNVKSVKRADLQSKQPGWKTMPCHFGTKCRGESSCRGYHGTHDRVFV